MPQCFENAPVTPDSTFADNGCPLPIAHNRRQWGCVAPKMPNKNRKETYEYFQYESIGHPSV